MSSDAIAEALEEEVWNLRLYGQCMDLKDIAHITGGFFILLIS